MDKPLKNPYVVFERVKIYDCKDCLQGFLSQRDYLLHEVQHLHKQILKSKYSDYNNDYELLRVNKCEECGLRFVLESTLKAHMAVHAPYPHVCHCGIGYYRSIDLISHKKLVHETKNVKTNQKFSDSKENVVAYKEKSKYKKGNNGQRLIIGRFRPDEKEDINGGHVCPVCGKAYNQVDKLTRHLNVHARDKDLNCDICKKRFAQQASLKQHLMRHARIKNEKCSYCDKLFLDKGNRLNHERTHTGVKPYVCSFCEKPFSDPSALHRHERIHTGDKRYKCEHCPKAFTDAGAAIRHRQTHLDNKRIYGCEICKKRFTMKYYLKSHMEVHVLEKNYQCDLCSKWFSRKQYLKTHISFSHEKDNRKHECHLCGKKFLFISELKMHHEKKHGNGYYQCGDCGKKFKTNHYLNQHVKTIHGNDRFLCNDCPKHYTMKKELYRHIMQKHLNIKCERCGAPFASSSQLGKHRRTGCVECLKCNKLFRSVKERNSHDKIFHLKQVKYGKCDICNRNYSHLSQHYGRYHCTDKKYQCDDCKESFSLKSLLKEHIRKKHVLALYCDTCRKPFYSEHEFRDHKKNGCQTETHLCDMCPRECTSLSLLKLHMIVHSKIYKYECDYCGDKFKYKNSIKRHFKLVHGL